MSDYDDRGAYTPPSDRLAFDPRTPVRGGGPAPVTLIVSGLVLVGLVGGVFFLYRDGFKHRTAAPALVGAPIAAARTPAAPLPAVTNNAPTLVVDKTPAPAPAPAFAPPPVQELPAPPAPTTAPSAITPLTPVSAPAGSPVAAKPSPPPVVVLTPAPMPKAAAPPSYVAQPEPAAAAPARRQALASPPVERPVVHHPAPMTIASLTDDALAHRARAAKAPRESGATWDDSAPRQVREPHARFVDAPPAPVAPPAHRAATTRENSATWDGSATRPVREPRVRFVDASPAPVAPPAHRAVVGAHIKGAQYAAAMPSRTAASAGSGWVQIGAFSSPSLADEGWRDIAHLEPDAMAGKGKAVQPLERDDGTTLYRTYVTGFASVSAAQAFCSELRASGKACMVK